MTLPNSTGHESPDESNNSKRRTILRSIEFVLQEIRAAIVQVIGDLAKENSSFHEREVEKHVVDPIVRGFISTIRRWTKDIAVSDAEARRAASKSMSEVWQQRREDREIDLAELEEELARLGYTAFTDPVGTPVNSHRHDPAERIIANKRRKVGLVAKVFRPGYMRPDGTILERQMVAIWVTSGSQ